MYPVTSLDIGSMFKTGMMAFGMIMVLILVAGGNYGDAVAYVVIPGTIKAIQFAADIPIIGSVIVFGIVIYAVLRRNGSI